jgi:hypothetical protein
MAHRGVPFFQQELTSVTRARETLLRESFQNARIARSIREKDTKGMKWGQRKGKTKAEGPGGHQIGTTQSGKPIPHFNHPIYQQRQKQAKWNVSVSPMVDSGGETGAKLLRQRTPNWSKQDHLDAAQAHGKLADASRKQWGQVADSAAKKTFGRPFQADDYRISGIGSDKFPDQYKNKLRELAQSETGHRSAAATHQRAASGRNFPSGTGAPQESQESFHRTARSLEHGVKGMKWGQKKQEPTRQDEKPEGKSGGGGGGEGTGVTRSGRKRGNVPDPGEREEYQGYHNWETWHTKLLIDNEQDSYNQAQALGKRGLYFQKKGDFNIDRLALAMKNAFSKQGKETTNYANENASRPEDRAKTINWREIAQNYLDEAKENEEYEKKKSGGEQK